MAEQESADHDHATPHEDGVKLAGGVNALLGIGIIAAPFRAGVDEVAMWGNVIAGVLVIGFAVYNARTAAYHDTAKVPGPAAMSLLIGVWLVLYPWLTGAPEAYRWTNTVLGALVVLTAAYNAWAGFADRQVGASRAGT